VPRKCTVCGHDESHQINVALVQSGSSNRRIASQYSVSERAIRAHRAEHLPELLLQASRSIDVANADDLLAKIEELYSEAMAVLEAGKDGSDYRLVLSAIDRAGKQLEVLAEMRGELNRQPVMNLLVAPEWVSLRTKLLYALDAYPQARGSVLRALEGAGDGRA
jgi:hypothetical protein